MQYELGRFRAIEFFIIPEAEKQVEFLDSVAGSRHHGVGDLIPYCPQGASSSRFSSTSRMTLFTEHSSLTDAVQLHWKNPAQLRYLSVNDIHGLN